MHLKIVLIKEKYEIKQIAKKLFKTNLIKQKSADKPLIK